MKNKKFFYLQYNKINWKNQAKTKLNENINQYIIDKIILEKDSRNLRVYDIGFGIGFFIEMLSRILAQMRNDFIIGGCEPSEKNFKYFEKRLRKIDIKNNIEVTNNSYNDVKTNGKYDFITAIYVFPHILSDDLNETTKKIYFMLDSGGKFVLVVANESYLARKLKNEKDLFIENNEIELNKKKYKEILHYSDIPKIGKIIDYNREDALYEDLFQSNGFVLDRKEEIDDNGFLATIFVFEKKGKLCKKLGKLNLKKR